MTTIQRIKLSILSALVGLALGPVIVIAGTIVDQGNPAPAGRAWPITGPTGTSATQIQGPVADGAADTAANPVEIGALDGTNIQTLQVRLSSSAAPSAAEPALVVNDSASSSGVTTEVLVLNSATTDVPATPLAGRRSMEIQNLGPNAIFCCLGTAASNCTAAANTSRQIGVDGTWSLDISDNIEVDCFAATADQLTTNGTIVTEVR